MAAWHLVSSKTVGQVWGHGEEWKRLARNALILGVVIFPLIYLLVSDQFSSLGAADPAYGDTLMFSLDRMLPGSGFSEIVPDGGWAQVLSYVEAFLGLVIAGMFISMLLKAISRR